MVFLRFKTARICCILILEIGLLRAVACMHHYQFKVAQIERAARVDYEEL